MPPFLKRLRAYKNRGKDPETMRRKRITQVLRCRKYKREEKIWKRRKLDEEKLSCDLMKFLSILKESDAQQIRNILLSTEGISRLLVSESAPFLDRVVESGMLACLAELHALGEIPELQSAAVAILVQLTSGNTNHVLAVVEAGVLPGLVSLLASNNVSVQSQAALALGNVASQGCHFAQEILDLGVVPPLMRLFESDLKDDLLKSALWLVQGLCQEKSTCPPPKDLKLFLPVLASLLYSSDSQISASVCASLCRLADSPNRIREILDARAVERLVCLTGEVEDSDMPHVLRLLASTAALGDRESCGLLLDMSFLARLGELLKHARTLIVQETLCLVANVAGGCSKRTQSVVEAGLLPTLAQLLEKGKSRTKRLAAWTVRNLSDCCASQLDHFLKANVPRALCQLLGMGKMDLNVAVLKTLEQMLAKARGTVRQREELITALRNNGIVKALEELQHVLRRDVRKAAEGLLELHFGESAKSKPEQRKYK